jgi:glutaredoxin
MKTLFLMLCIIIAASANAESLYRWVDKDGKVHYGDRPAEDAVKAEQKRFSATGGDVDLPYNVRKARQDFPVTLYVSQKCGDYCVQARTFLNKRGIPFSEKNLSTQEDLDAFKTQFGGNSVPSLTVGKTLLSGYEAGQWNNELDIAGYPNTPFYGFRPAASASVAPAGTPETEPAANK